MSFFGRAGVLLSASIVVIVGCRTLFVTPTGGGSTSADATVDADAPDPEEVPGFFGAGANDVVNPPPRLETAPDEGEEPSTFSFFKAIQVDPRGEDSSGAKFVVAGDLDNDGLPDLVSGWNESQPVQIHLQRRDAGGDVTFQTVTLAGTGPVAVMAGVELGDFNGDGWLDVAVLVKADGSGAFDTVFCPNPDPPDPPPPPQLLSITVGEIILLFNPGLAGAVADGDQWLQTVLVNSIDAGREDVPFEDAETLPDQNGYTGVAVGDVTGDGLDDVVTTFNPVECEFTGQQPPRNRLEVWPNPGAGQAVNGGAWLPVLVDENAPTIGDVAVAHVDDDDLLDLVYTFPDSITSNVSWAHNLGGGTLWELRPIGQVDTLADVITIGDVDNDGFDDVMVRSRNGRIVQWFRRPTTAPVEPVFPPGTPPLPDRFNFPWQVFTLAEFAFRVPAGTAIGDLDGDGVNETVIASGGVIAWYQHDPAEAESEFNLWPETTMIDDTKELGTTDDPSNIEFEDDGTVSFSLLVVDVDGDGSNDVLATLDRRVNSGIANDTLIWFRNVLGEAPTTGGGG